MLTGPASLKPAAPSPEAVLRRTAVRARQLIVAGGGLLPEPVPGYAARVLDGNVLTGAEHRIAPRKGGRT